MAINSNTNLIKSISVYDINNYTDKYQIGDYIISSPYIKSLSKYYPTLLYNSETIPMNSRYMYRPDYVSYDYYNTTSLWYVILYMNNIQTMCRFNIPNIIVPNWETLNTIMSQTKVDTSIITNL
jgi:hypothetical protein